MPGFFKRSEVVRLWKGEPLSWWSFGLQDCEAHETPHVALIILAHHPSFVLPNLASWRWGWNEAPGARLTTETLINHGLLGCNIFPCRVIALGKDVEEWPHQPVFVDCGCGISSLNLYSRMIAPSRNQGTCKRAHPQ